MKTSWWHRWRIAWHMWLRGLPPAADDLADGIDLGDHDCGISALPRTVDAETATLRAAEALELAAEAWASRAMPYPALRLANLARQAEEVAAEESARRRAEVEAGR